jgi:hypothetical protein
MKKPYYINKLSVLFMVVWLIAFATPGVSFSGEPMSLIQMQSEARTFTVMKGGKECKHFEGKEKPCIIGPGNP